MSFRAQRSEVEDCARRRVQASNRPKGRLLASRNLGTYSYIGGEIGAKILRLPSVAQDDTVILTVLRIKADNHNAFLEMRNSDE